MKKDSIPIDLTDDGILISQSDMHEKKALSHIDVTVGGISIYVSETHIKNIYLLIEMIGGS